MRYNKLVRDKIPEIMISHGEKPIIRTLTQEEYTLALETKLDEEVHEFHIERNLEELADIMEVVYALASDLGATRDELWEVYRKKHEARGGFAKRTYLISKE